MRSNYSSKIGFHFFLLLILFNCSLTDNEEYSELIPIEMGNSWTYVYYEYHGGEIDPRFTDTTTTQISDVISVEYNGQIFQEVGVFEGLNVLGNSIHEYKKYYHNSDLGFYFLGGESPTDTFLINSLVYLYPVAVGDSWQRQSYVYNYGLHTFQFADSFEYRCTSNGKYLDTPAGSFKSVVYSYKSKFDVHVQWNYDVYVKPGVGTIGVVVVDDLGVLISKTLLVEYTLN